jgi:hypothetical protein
VYEYVNETSTATLSTLRQHTHVGPSELCASTPRGRKTAISDCSLPKALQYRKRGLECAGCTPQSGLCTPQSGLCTPQSTASAISINQEYKEQQNKFSPRHQLAEQLLDRKSAHLVRDLLPQAEQARHHVTRGTMFETAHKTDGSAKDDNDDDTNLFYLLPPWVPWPFFSAAFCLLLFFLGSSFIKQQSKQINIPRKQRNQKESASKYLSSRQQQCTTRSGSSGVYFSMRKQPRTSRCGSSKVLLVQAAATYFMFRQQQQSTFRRGSSYTYPSSRQQQLRTSH